MTIWKEKRKMNKVIDKGFRSCRFVSTIVKHPVCCGAVRCSSYVSATYALGRPHILCFSFFVCDFPFAFLYKNNSQFIYQQIYLLHFLGGR